MSKNHKTYQENFIEGVRMFMAKNNTDSIKAVASILGITYMSLYKVMDGSNKPTVDQGVILCNCAGYSANWLFLDKGQVYYSQELESIKVSKELKALRELISTK